METILKVTNAMRRMLPVTDESLSNQQMKNNAPQGQFSNKWSGIVNVAAGEDYKVEILITPVSRHPIAADQDNDHHLVTSFSEHAPTERLKIFLDRPRSLECVL
jgi:hypothetical protein